MASMLDRKVSLSNTRLQSLAWYCPEWLPGSFGRAEEEFDWILVAGETRIDRTILITSSVTGSLESSIPRLSVVPQ